MRSQEFTRKLEAREFSIRYNADLIKFMEALYKEFSEYEWGEELKKMVADTSFRFGILLDDEDRLENIASFTKRWPHKSTMPFGCT